MFCFPSRKGRISQSRNGFPCSSIARNGIVYATGFTLNAPTFARECTGKNKYGRVQFIHGCLPRSKVKEQNLPAVIRNGSFLRYMIITNNLAIFCGSLYLCSIKISDQIHSATFLKQNSYQLLTSKLACGSQESLLGSRIFNDSCKFTFSTI